MGLIFKFGSRQAILFLLFFSQISLAVENFLPLPPDEETVTEYHGDVIVEYPKDIVSVDDFADPLKLKLCSHPYECQLLKSEPQYYDFYQKQQLTKFSFYGKKGDFKRVGDYIYSSVFQINYKNEGNTFVNTIDYYKNQTEAVKFQAFDLKKGILVTIPVSQPWFSLDHKDCVILKFEAVFYQNGDKCTRVYPSSKTGSDVPKLRSWALNESLTKVALIYENGFIRIFDAKNGQLLTEGSAYGFDGFLDESIFYSVLEYKDKLVFNYYQTKERATKVSYSFKLIKSVEVPFKNELLSGLELMFTRPRARLLTETDIKEIFNGNLELSNLANRTQKDVETELNSPNRTIHVDSLSRGSGKMSLNQKMIYHDVITDINLKTVRPTFLVSVNDFKELFNFRFDSIMSSGGETYPLIMRSEDENGKFVVFAGNLYYSQYDHTSSGVRLDVFRAKKVLVEGGIFEQKKRVMPDCFQLNTGNMSPNTQMELPFDDVFTPPTQICYGFKYTSSRRFTFYNLEMKYGDSKILDPEVRTYFDDQLLPTIFEEQKFSVIGAKYNAEVYEYETNAFAWKQNNFKIRMHKEAKSIGGSFETSLFLTLISADGKENKTFRYQQQ